MPVGATIGYTQINNTITALAVQMRTLMTNINNLNMSVNGQNAGLAYLVSIGYDNTANPDNPGGISDAQYALNMIAYLNTVAGFYFGTAGAQPAYNYNNELSQVWAGQVT